MKETADVGLNRILFASTAMDGHLNPLLPLSLALKEQGHTIAFATADHFARSKIEDLGFEHLDAGVSEDTEEMREFHRKRVSLQGRELASFMQGAFTGIRAKQMVGPLVEHIRKWQPDVIVHEDFCFGAANAAELTNTPNVCYQVTAPRPDIIDLSGNYLNEARRSVGLPEVDNLDYLSRYLHLSNRPPEMVTPHLRKLPTYHAFRNPSENPLRLQLFPTEMFPGNPTIHLTLGTVPIFNQNTWLFQNVIDAVKDRSINLVITTGKNQDPSVLQYDNDRVAVEKFIPISSLLPQTNAVIFHGGSGTLTACIEHAVAMIVTPLGADQFINAGYIKASETGLIVPKEEATASRYQLAIEELLGDLKYRRKIQEVQTSWRSLPDIRSAVKLVEKVAHSTAISK